MSDPVRLLDSDADAFERSLLSSAKEDRGSEAAKEQALAALAATAGSPGPADGSVGPGASALGLPQWIGLSLLAGGLFSGGWTLLQPQEERAAETPPAAKQAIPAAPAVEAKAEAEPRPFTAQQGEPSERPLASLEAAPSPAPPVAPAQKKVVRRKRPPSQDATAVGSDLRAEVRLLDRARAALAQHAPRRALRTLDEYARRFASGVLVPESRVLRVRCLVAAGDLDRARAEAKRFLAQHPSGAHARAVRNALSATSKP